MADLEHYNSTRDEFDSSLNGGAMTDELIESEVAHSFMLPVRPMTAEAGGERWFKFYIKATVDTITLGVNIAKTSSSPTEEVYICLATDDDEVEDDVDKENIRLFGGFIAESYDKDDKKVIANIDVSTFVKADDKVTFFDSENLKVTSWIVDSVDAKEIIFKDVNDDDVTGLYASSTIEIDELSTDEHIGFWIKQEIASLTEPMEDPLNRYILGTWYDLK